MSIHTFAEKIKGRAGEKRVSLLSMLVLVCTAAISFWLGYTAQKEVAQVAPVVISCPATAYMPTNTSLAGQGAPTGPTGLSASAIDAVKTAPITKGAYVASKNGTKYYPVGCSGVNRIKEENKVYFTTIKEAVSAGYGPAANCK